MFFKISYIKRKRNVYEKIYVCKNIKMLLLIKSLYFFFFLLYKIYKFILPAGVFLFSKPLSLASGLNGLAGPTNGLTKSLYGMLCVISLVPFGTKCFHEEISFIYIYILVIDS